MAESCQIGNKNPVGKGEKEEILCYEQFLLSHSVLKRIILWSVKIKKQKQKHCRKKEKILVTRIILFTFFIIFSKAIFKRVVNHMELCARMLDINLFLTNET